jgi:hypothetical protein
MGSLCNLSMKQEFLSKLVMAVMDASASGMKNIFRKADRKAATAREAAAF